MWIILHPETGARLCNDKVFRDWAPMGYADDCVKTYKREGYAQRIAEEMNVEGKTHIVNIEGKELNAQGELSSLNATWATPVRYLGSVISK